MDMKTLSVIGGLAAIVTASTAVAAEVTSEQEYNALARFLVDGQIVEIVW